MVVEITYLICHVALQDHVMKRFYDFIQNFMTLSKFGSHSHCGSGDLTYDLARTPGKRVF